MAILPGATVGIFGGGQLGRMTAMAAREMGYRIRVLDPDPECAARYVVEAQVVASFDDVEAASELAGGCDVVTFEIEKVSGDVLRQAARSCPVRPNAELLEIIQDRGRQKNFLFAKGLPVGPFRLVSGAEELSRAVTDLGGRTFIKAREGGYDGRGQIETSAAEDVAAAAQEMGDTPCVVEQFVPFERELSVMVARNPSGDVRVYPVAHNHHHERILAWSVLPAWGVSKVMRQAEDLARETARAFQIEGILCVEMFEKSDGTLLINEVAPRPHNSFHAASLACETSQFEQHVRAVCDLPLGSTEVVRPSAIANLLGDLWQDGVPPFDRLLALPGVRLFLYGKAPRKGRKMGHIMASGRTPEEAISLVRCAEDALLRR